MTEQEKRLAGRLYYPPDPELTEARMRAKRLCHRLNTLAPDDFQGREDVIRELFGSAGKDAWVESNFRCDYGTQIALGDYVFINYDCIFLDIAPSPSETGPTSPPGSASTRSTTPRSRRCGTRIWSTAAPSSLRTTCGLAATR